jgi:predicted P-loop ATPase
MNNGQVKTRNKDIDSENTQKIRQQKSTKGRNEKLKTLAIVEVQQALNDWYDLRFNEITNVVEGRKKGENSFKTLNENNIYIQLLTSGYRVSYGVLCALLNSDFVPSYNPFIEYFESLDQWGQNDLDFIEELANHVKAKDQVQFNHHLKKMMVRMIACALDNHVFNKHAFILVGGAQHSGKSTFCRYLCPTALNNYFSETIPGDKDGLISLSENFMTNLDELTTLSKFELNHLKSLFSKESVRVRHPFARKAQTDPRRVSFVGSTNEDSFLTDTTGSVRWLCFEITSIDWSYKETPIDKAWSQAYALYKSGFKYQLTSEEIQINESRNEQFQQVTMEYEYIQMYLSPGNVMDNDTFWTTTQIKDHIIWKSERKAEIKNLDRLGKALRQLGFERFSKRMGDSKKPTHGYFVKYLDKD